MPINEAETGSNTKNGYSCMRSSDQTKPYGSYNNGQKAVDHFKELNEYRMVNWKSIVICRLNSKSK